MGCPKIKVATFASQQEGSGFISTGWRGPHCGALLPVPELGFLQVPHLPFTVQGQACVRLIGASNLAIDVNMSVNCCLSLC